MKRLFLPLLIVLLLVACQSEPVTSETVLVNGGSYQNIDAKGLNEMLKDKDFVLVNVHIPFAGSIAGTDLSIPYNEIDQNLSQLPAVEQSLFAEPEEKKLYRAIEKNVKARPSTVDELLNIVVKLIPSINAFFDKVLVMADDENVRQNRLALVGQVANLSYGVADLSKLEGF